MMKYIVLIMALLLSFGATGQPTQSVEISVLDGQTKAAMQGVTISVKSDKSLVGVTNTQGKYTFKIDAQHRASIKITYPGYKPEERILNKEHTLRVAMTPSDLASFQDNITMPLGDIATSKITTAAAGVTYLRSQLEGVESVDQFLKSKIAGLNVQANGGMPGEATSMMIRGRRSIHGSSYPLIVLNGVILENTAADGMDISNYYDNALHSIDIKDVENITILKSGNAIYGAQGSAGVILINTFRPQQLETTIEASANFGIAFKTKELPMLAGADNKQYLYEQMQNSGMSVNDILVRYPWMSSDPDYVYTNRYNNNTLWQDEIFRNSFAHNYHLIVRGGDAAAKYVFSLGYLKRGATVESSDFDRYNARLNADIKLAKRLNLQVNTSYSVSDSNIADDMRGGVTSLVGSALGKSPLFHPNIIDYEGVIYPSYDDIDPLGMANPAAIRSKVENKLMTNDFYGSAGLVYNITNDLNISHTIGVNYYKMRGNAFVPYTGIGGFKEGHRLSGRYINEYLGVFNETRLSWAHTYNVVHSLGAIIGFRVTNNHKEQDNMRDYGLANDEYKSSSTDAASTSNLDKKFVNGANNIWNRMAGFATVNYSWRQLLYASATFTAEASSKYGSKERWQYFPAISAAMRLTSLDALKQTTWLSELKLRAGWDQTGNEDIGCYTSRGYYSSVMYRGFEGIVRKNIGNDNLKNEVTSQWNIGLDFAIFNNRLMLSADFYHAKTKDVLIENRIDQHKGDLYYFSNGAEIMDQGFEFSMSGRLINTPTVKWDMNVNLTLPHSEITKMSGENVYAIAGGSIAYLEGSAPGVFYGYKADGVFASTQAAHENGLTNADGQPFEGGDIKYQNQNSDQMIDSHDRVVIGNPLPDIYGAISTTVQIKKFSLSATLDFTSGNDIFNYVRMQTESMSGYANQSTAVNRRWTTEGQLTDMPRAIYGAHTNSAFSTRWIEDGSYLRLRNITIAYDFGFKKIIKSAKVYISANNLFTSTKYLGFDPEVGTSGVDYGKIPQTRGLMMGIKLNF